MHRPSDMSRALYWANRRSEARYANSVLDESFDAPEEVDPCERMVYGAFDGDMHGRPERGGHFGRSCDARRKRRTVSTEEPERRLPTNAPPGWARP